VPSPPYLIPKTAISGQRGQSLVEFAVSSVVLLLLVGGLVDIGRSIYVSEAMSNAVREGARHGAFFDAPTQSHPYLYDASIKAAVDAELASSNLPASILKNPGTTCPTVTDGNSVHNPPYASSAYPITANLPWLYICYNNTPGLDFTSPATNQGQLDLVKTQFGVFQVAATQHMTVQGS
jgi:Flp pilus assembly protein TadG